MTLRPALIAPIRTRRDGGQECVTEDIEIITRLIMTLPRHGSKIMNFVTRNSAAAPPSSSGRTAGLGPANGGSNPSGGTSPALRAPCEALARLRRRDRRPVTYERRAETLTSHHVTGPQPTNATAPSLLPSPHGRMMPNGNTAWGGAVVPLSSRLASLSSPGLPRRVCILRPPGSFSLHPRRPPTRPTRPGRTQAFLPVRRGRGPDNNPGSYTGAKERTAARISAARLRRGWKPRKTLSYLQTAGVLRCPGSFPQR